MSQRESYLTFPDQKDANARFDTHVGTLKYLITKPIKQNRVFFNRRRMSVKRKPGVKASQLPNHQIQTRLEKLYQPCPLCEGQHSLVKCRSFLNKSVDQRSDVIHEKGLCYGCFKQSHMSAGCRDRFTCEECGRHH